MGRQHYPFGRKGVNVAHPRDADYADDGRTGIGVAGDSIHFAGHGGDHQAVDTMNPLFAREVRERLAVIHRAG
jgi:hypothetical protein